MRRLFALLLLLPLAALPSSARVERAPLALDVTPACCAITFTAYMFGIFPLEGRFGAFSGRLDVAGSGVPARAEARIDAASLSLDGGPIEADVKAPHFLDVVHHRQILFRGEAPAGEERLEGELTIKGVTRPVSLTLRQDRGLVTAETRISRSAFGITARPVLAGDTIAIRISAPLPR
jgi:polyisoprenoid-binding protein YceI